MMAKPGLCFRYNMENISTNLLDGDGVGTPVAGTRYRIFDPKSETYLSPKIKKILATEDIPRAVEIEVVRGNEEEERETDLFRRSSLLLHSPPRTAEQQGEISPSILKVRSLPIIGDPVVRMERLPDARTRRASTPLKTTRMEGDDSVAVTSDVTLMQEGQSEDSAASSSVFVPSKYNKRGRVTSSESTVSASDTGDEASAAAPEEMPKKKAPRTTSVIDKIKARRKERVRERQQERANWEKKRMEDPNLVIPPAANLPGMEKVVEELENQSTPDLTAEIMQVVKTIEKVAITSKNLKGGYVGALRRSALKVHAGVNLLARRIYSQDSGDKDEALVKLRRRNRALQLDKGRLEEEARQAKETRRDLEKIRRDCEDLRRRNKELEREVSDIKARLVEGDAPRSSPPPLQLSIPDPAVGGARDPPALSGSRSAPVPLPGGWCRSLIRITFSSSKWRGWLLGSWGRWWRG